MSDMYLKIKMLKLCLRSRTNTWLQFFVLIVFHDCENVQTSTGWQTCGFDWKHLSYFYAVLFGVLLGLIFLKFPSLSAINNIIRFSMRKQRNCRVLRPSLGCTVVTKQRYFSYLTEIYQFWRRFLWRWFFLETIYPIAKQNHHKSVLLQDSWQSSFLSRGDCCKKNQYFKFWLRVHNWRNGLKTFFSRHSSVGHVFSY